MIAIFVAIVKDNGRCAFGFALAAALDYAARAGLNPRSTVIFAGNGVVRAGRAMRGAGRAAFRRTFRHVPVATLATARELARELIER